MAATARTLRTLQELTELPQGARPLEFVRRKRDRAEDSDEPAARDAAGKGAKGAPTAHVMPAVHISLGQVAQAAGSAYIEVGRAKMLCTVHGPRSDSRAAHFSEAGRLVCQVQFAAFSGMCEAQVERLSRELPLVIHPALEAAVQLKRFPKSLVEVHVLVLEQDGDVCGPAIMGASLALADAGIEMFDLVAACSVARTAGGGGGLEIGPTNAQLHHFAAGGSLVIAIMPVRGEVTQLSHVGQWDTEDYEEAIDLGQAVCKQLHSLMRQALVVRARAVCADGAPDS